jgi:SAM-dependent methyltransferase
MTSTSQSDSQASAETEARTMSHQKVCDIYDLFNPEIDHILRQELRSSPFGSRRAWEFAMIFRSLRMRGKLNGESHGLGMGAGTEKLIYALIRHVRELLVTDLYVPDSRWVGVRTDNPKDLVLKKAPWPIDASRLDVRAMDMRSLDCPDDSFDFAWSTGAFEHIGNDEDFARHLTEVDRVLKPGGVYVFTTAVVFGPKTLNIPNNYYFHPAHLVDLLHASPLHPDPEFDCGIKDHIFNRPHPERFQDYGMPAASKFSKPIVSFRRGALLAANIISLTKDSGRLKTRPIILGYDQTTTRLVRERDLFVSDLWRDFQQISLEGDAGEYSTQPQWFGKSIVQINLLAEPARLPKDCTLVLKSRPVDYFGGWDTEYKWQLGEGLNRFAFTTTDNKLYTFTINLHHDALPDSVVLRARHQIHQSNSPAAARSVQLTSFLARAKRAIKRRLTSR